MNKIEKIRKFVIEKEGKDNLTNRSSDLNWLRIIRQIKEVNSNIKKSAKVLDIGCGDGLNPFLMKLMRPDLNIVGINPNYCDFWKHFKKKGLAFKIGNGLKLKYKDNSFDVVTTFGVMEHINEEYVRFYGKREFKNEELRFMKEIYRILKPGGLNIISNLPNKYSITEGLTKLLGKRYHINRFDEKEINTLIKKSGFKKVKIRREFIIPAQIYKINKKLLSFFNKHHKILDKIDNIINKTPLNLFSQSYFIVCKKP